RTRPRNRSRSAAVNMSKTADSSKTASDLWFRGGDDARLEGILHKGRSIVPELQERRMIDVHHVPGLIERHSHIVTDGRIELHRMQSMLSRVVRCSEIVIATAD